VNFVHCSGELTDWIERRLMQLRKMAAELNESDTDAEDMTQDDSTDPQAGREFFSLYG